MNSEAAETPSASYIACAGPGERPLFAIALCADHADVFYRLFVPELKKAFGARFCRFPIGGVFGGLGAEAAQPQPCRWCAALKRPERA